MPFGEKVPILLGIGGSLKIEKIVLRLQEVKGFFKKKVD